MGFRNTQVQARATVEIRSPGIGVMPLYAVQGCDYGPQTLTDPSNGQTVPVVVPALDANDADTNGVTLAGLSTLPPSAVPVNTSGAMSGYTVTLTDSGNQMDTVTQVGFFRASGSTGTTKVTVPTAQITFTGKKSVTIDIPQSVDSVQAVWYVRVMDASGQWSKRSDAQPLRIGNAVLECAGTSNDGNFGSLKIPRSDINDATTNGWLPTNMAKGLQQPLSLDLYRPTATAPVVCGSNGTALPPGIASDKNNLRPHTNCVDTDTGLPANAATSGMISGVSSSPGRLDKNTTSGCGANAANRNARWDTGIKISGSTSYTINDDVLTCFFTDSTTTINQIVQPNYHGPSVLSAAILDSPRFFFVPVLKQQPVSGGSDMYSIIDFRPAFLTDQPVTATKAGMELGSTTAHNGLTISSGSIETMKVIFFNIAALPETIDGSIPTTDYMGFGTKVITLVD